MLSQETEKKKIYIYTPKNSKVIKSDNLRIRENLSLKKLIMSPSTF